MMEEEMAFHRYYQPRNKCRPKALVIQNMLLRKVHEWGKIWKIEKLMY
jgi:hypothetical protein